MIEDRGGSPHSVDKHVGSRVRLKRSMMGLSQEKLATQLGITFQQVQKYEKGTNRIGASRMFEICQILQIPVGFLFQGMQTSDNSNSGMAENDSPDYVTDFLASSEGIQLNKSFMNIPDPLVRKRIIDLLKTLEDKSND